MKFVFRLALFAAVLSLPFAVPASAQYMYMDSNGNGIHDAGDRLNANNDSTVVDIYLNTTLNRNGSAVTCNTSATAVMDINSYAFCLVASGGTATYRNYISRQTVAFPNHAEMLNPGDGTYKDAFYSFSYTAGGLFRLGTLTITGTGGSPKIDFVDIVGASQDFTSFGTPCPGIAGDNTYRLDGPNTQAFYGGPGDWSDADGLAAAVGGNNPPVVTNPGNKTTNELVNLAFTVTATDPDAGQTLAYSLDAGTVANGATIGSASGAFSWTPTEAQGPGVYPVTVTATDNGTPAPQTGSAGFSVTVNEVNVAPVLAAIGNKTVTVNTPLGFTATATDADIPANAKIFSLTGAPAGATISSATGIFSWTPTATGTFPLTVTVTDDGSPVLNDTEGITITVSPGANQAPVLAAIGNKSVSEEALLSFTATANDPDAGQTLAFSLDAGSPAGAAITGAGAFSWTPTEAQGPGSYPVTIRVTDSGSPAMEDFEAISIAVSEVNVAPVLAAIGNQTATVGLALAFTAAATDADLPANALTFSLDAGAPAGATIGATTGAFSYTPSANGTFPVTVRVTDNGTPPLSDFEAISIAVSAAPNVNPVLAAIGNKTVDEEAALSFTATATDADAGQTLTFSLDAGAPAGASINASTGAFSWTPAEADGPGSHSITVRVTDDGTPNLSDSETISVTVNEVNVAPVLAVIGDKATTVGVAVAFTATATDADVPANTLAFSLDAGAPAGATIGATTGAFSYTPSANGTFPVTVRVTDNGTPPLSAFEAISIVVSAAPNVNPVLAAIGDKTVDEEAALTFTATATDADAGQTLTFSLDAGAPAGAAINAATGAFGWTPAEADGPGSHSITVRVTDDGTPNLGDSETISVTVNEVNVAPVLAAIGNKAGTVGVEVAFTASATDADVPANTLTFSLDAGAPSGATINGSTGAFSWTPSASGSFAATVRVTDNGTPALDDFEAITIDVSGGVINNNPPVLAAIGNKTVDEEALLSFTATATDADAGQTLTFSLDAGAPSGAAITAGGAFSWTPGEADGPGSHPVTVRVTDNGTPNLSASEAITITVNEVNVAPVLAAIGNKAGTVGVEVAFTATATDADVPANTLTFSLDAGGPGGATINGSTGAFSWTPSATGSFAATVRVTDNGTPALDDFEAITIDVTEAAVNHAPVLDAIGNKAVDEGLLLSFTATATDADAGQTLAFSLDTGGPSGAAITAGGVFSWTPTEAQGPGSYPVTIRVTDNGSPAMDDFEAITIDVNEVNAAPVLAAIGNKTGTVGTPVAFTATATDADVPANALTFSLDAGAPAGAAIDATTGAFSWTPSASGSYAATVRVTDDGGPALSDFETITIGVIGVVELNSPPVLDAIGNKTVDEETLLSFTATATDADAGQTLTFSLDSGAPSGAAITAGGVFSWTPTEAQGPGVYPVTVTVTDNAAQPAHADGGFTITVNEVNVAPVLAAIGNKTGTVGVDVAFTAAATDADVPANALTFSLDAGGPAGATINGSTGAFSWTPSATGSFAATVRVTDNGTPPLDDFEAITIDVTEAVVNHAPVLDAIGNKSGTVGVEVAFTATATDADAGQTLTFSLDSGAPAGATINGSTGAFSWTPSATGSFAATVRVTDNGTPALDDFEAITITVSPSGQTVDAHAFFFGRNLITILDSRDASTCVQIEPVRGSYSNDDVDLSSIVMIYGGNQITASAALDGDKNHNRVREIRACFSKADLRSLFSGLSRGFHRVEVTIEGNLASGGRFHDTVNHFVFVPGSGGGCDLVAQPNPLNPETILSFTTTQRGPVTVRVFDISGRLVKTLQDGTLPAGFNSIRWDGSADNGTHVATGVYFVKMISLDGEQKLRLTVLK